MHLKFRNVNSAFQGLVNGIHEGRIPTYIQPSRNGETLQVAEPMIVTYERPLERVLFNLARDANPFFHLFESLHMLAGRNDIAPLTKYAKQIANYSDDGKTQNGAYGYRWRNSYGGDSKEWYESYNGQGRWERTKIKTDQLAVLAEHLKKNPNSRRAVLQMWNVEDDLLKVDTSRDVCCNLSVLFLVENGPCLTCDGRGQVDEREGGAATSGWVKCPDCNGLPSEVPRYLNMTVTNRSNDLCLSGETKFRSPEGDTSITDLADKFAKNPKFRFPVYSVNTKTGSQKLTWMTRAWRTGRKRTIKIGFDDGSFVRLTPDHVLFKKVRIHQGKLCVGLKIEEVEAGSLKIGDRVLADLPESAKARNGQYVEFKKNLFSNTNYENMGDEHREYWEFANGVDLGSDEVHHKDENKRNNKLTNLERTTKSEHRAHHLRKSNPNDKMTPDQVFARASKGGKTHKGRKLTDTHRDALSKAAKKAQAHRVRTASGRYASNHKIVSIEDGGWAEVYDFTVPGDHNAVLNNGVLVHNCWGMLGANVVHFSFLQEYMAARLGLEVGVYNQFTNNLHVYTETNSGWHPKEWLKEYDGMYPPGSEVYAQQEFKHFPLVQNVDAFDREVKEFIDHAEELRYWSEPFLEHVAKPLCWAFMLHKQRQYAAAIDAVKLCQAADWKHAAFNWISKRHHDWEEKQNA